MSDQLTIDEHLERASLHGVLLLKTARPDAPGAPGCWFGGWPTMPETLDWPTYDDYEYGELPLVFLAQISLAELAKVQHDNQLPKTGTLFFFFDPLRASIDGFDFGGTAVLYTSDDVSELPEREMPDYPDFPENAEFGPWIAEGDAYDLDRWNFTFVPIEGSDASVADNGDQREASYALVRVLRERITDEYEQVRAGNNSPKESLHNMFVGPYGDGWDGPDIPLLSIWDDPDLGLFHADQRILAFTISQEALSNNNFDAVRVIDAG